MKDKLKLLVSGFGPFEQFSNNSSQKIAEIVDGLSFFGVEVIGTVIDVTWKGGWKALKSKVDELNPHALLCLGLAPEPVFRIESIAKNVAMRSFDVIGDLPSKHPDNRIVSYGPANYETQLPAARLIDAFNALERNSPIKARISDDAGAYLCNYVFYRVMHRYQKLIPYRGFVHVPPLPEDMPGSPYTEEELMEAGMFLVKHLAGWLKYQSMETDSQNSIA